MREGDKRETEREKTRDRDAASEREREMEPRTHLVDKRSVEIIHGVAPHPSRRIREISLHVEHFRERHMP